ncbi:hypothetical protein PROFUN_04039 [Planoprotostelium fungivorum]|uniref:Uncharacterized protein n=1 Tax=Planoprotostelium fungivorum TaxID=1890364 RepID=A0A2P6NWA7_9EUKA|nr:hypothetical protein PROFUN_04039 [Planoprotostelium fungivorum]
MQLWEKFFENIFQSASATPSRSDGSTQDCTTITQILVTDTSVVTALTSCTAINTSNVRDCTRGIWVYDSTNIQGLPL